MSGPDGYVAWLGSDEPVPEEMQRAAHALITRLMGATSVQIGAVMDGAGVPAEHRAFIAFSIITSLFVGMLANDPPAERAKILRALPGAIDAELAIRAARRRKMQ